MFVASSAAAKSGEKPAVLLITSFCPGNDVGANHQQQYPRSGGRRSEDSDDDAGYDDTYPDVVYCAENLIQQRMPTTTTNWTTENDGFKKYQGSSSSYPETQASADTAAAKPGASNVAVAILGTFGLLILLALLVMSLVHFWRKYFGGGKGCLTYASDGMDSNLSRNNHNDVDNDDEDTDRDSIRVDDFLEYVMSMHADSDNGFAKIYERVERTCSSSEFLQKLSYEHSVRTDNKMKNRYVNILAYDHSRVRLRHVPGVKNSDYINANFVDGYRQRRAFIATQGPLSNTLGDFWRMVWEQRCTVIVMITNIIERGRKKCEQYWPSDGEVFYGDFAVSLLSERATAFYTVRTMTVRSLAKKASNDEDSRIITQFHCTCWADHGVPESASTILKFIQKSKEANRDPAAPIIVHCSAGVGRSGTYIVIDAMLRQMRMTNSLNIYGFLKHIRQQRMCLVQTEEQFIFCYDALAEAVLLGDTEIDVQDFRRVISDCLSSATIEVNNSGSGFSSSRSDCSALARQFERIASLKTRSCSEAKKPFNMRKNAENALLPADDSRVTISAIPGETGSDYINASFLPGYNRTDEYIVTQIPMEETVKSFWRMIIDHQCRLIVLLTRDCKPFWPESSDAGIDTGGSISVSCSSSQTNEKDMSSFDLIVRSKLDDSADLHCQVLLIDWSTISERYESVWDVIRTARMKQFLSIDHQGGPLVAVDRWGGRAAATFCLLSAIYCQLDEECCLDVYTLASCYQERRPGVFPSLTDYLYLYDCLNFLITSRGCDSAVTTNVAESDQSSPNNNLDSSESYATRSKSLPSSLRAKSNYRHNVSKYSPSSSSRRPPSSCNGCCHHNVPLDTTL